MLPPFCMRSMLLQHGMQQFERAALANLCPEKVEEAHALVPSLFSQVTGIPQTR